jgi:Ala-tRNA(Pro) deacylase
MTMSPTLCKYLAQHGIAYDHVSHRHTSTSMDTASTTKIPGGKLAKPVILEDYEGYVMAVIPANNHVKIGKLNHVLGRHLGLATEPELGDLFSDCEPGAVPPIGEAYGIDTIVDDKLTKCSDVYLEAGDHEDLLHLKGPSFRKLMKHSKHASII